MTPFTVPMEQVITATLTGARDDEATIEAVRETPAAEIQRLFDDLRRRSEQFGPVPSPSRLFQPPSVIDRAVYRVSPSTGLTSSYEGRRTFTGEARGSVRTILSTTKLERLPITGN